MSKINYPNPTAKFSDKLKKEYGVQIGKMIEQDWFNNINESNTEHGSRREWIRNNRLFVRGEQDVKEYKDHVSRETGDLDYYNLDWTPLNIAQKYCNIVSNGIDSRYFKVDIRAIDKTSVSIRENKEKNMRKNMRSKKLFENAKKALGIDLMPQGFIPDDEEELRMFMEIKDRPAIEISEELIIDYVKKTSDFESIEDAYKKDLVVNGIAVMAVDTDQANGVQVRYVDPEFFVHSQTSRQDFKDCFYAAEVRSLTISDLKRESDIPEKDLRIIAKTWASRNNIHSPSNFDNINFREIADVRVDVLDFTYKTTKTVVYKKSGNDKGRTKISRKDENYNPPKRSDYGRLDETTYTWMEGKFIVGTEYVYNYKESENIVRDELDNPIPKYIIRSYDIYKNRLHSFLTNIKPLIVQMQYIHMKLQHLLAELKPDPININVNQLAEISGTDDREKDWKMALNLLNVKGVILSKVVDLGELGVQSGPAAAPVAVQQGGAIVHLLNSWAHYHNEIRNISGINPVRDGSQPHDSLVGTNEMALLASNTSTQHIVDAATRINKDLAKVISRRVHDIFDHKAKHLIKIYENAVGKHGLDKIAALKNRSLAEFGFVVEMVPTNEQIKEFKEDLSLAMQEGYIDVEVKMEAESIADSSFKMAREYLKYRRRKMKKEKALENQANIEAQGNINARNAQVAEQAKSQSYQRQAQVDIQKEAALTRIRMAEKRYESQLKKEEKEHEFPFELALKEIDAAAQMDKFQKAEDRKDERTRIQASQQSKILDQRNKNSQPIDFESFSLSNSLGL